MDRLPERDRAALRAAAVVGQRFPLALVRRLAQLPDYSCDILIAHFLVRPEGEEFLFAHALIRDGVYASLTRGRRAELHRAAADWYGERDPALRAEHLDRAEAPEAPRAYLDAALAHRPRRCRPERALALVDRGAALAREPDDVVALNMLRGRLRCESGEGQPAVDAYEVALAATRQAADRCRALIGIAAGHRLIDGRGRGARGARRGRATRPRGRARARTVRAALHAGAICTSRAAKSRPAGPSIMRHWHAPGRCPTRCGRLAR